MDATGLIQVLQLFYFFIVLLEITTCAMDVSLHVGKQGPFMYGNFHKRINGSVFRKNDSLISALEVNSDIECASLCVMDKVCLSVNFGSDTKSTGKVQCELLNYGATDYENHLVKKDKFFFMRMENICSIKNPCGNKICTPRLQHYAEQPYLCSCPETCAGDLNCNALGMEDGRILDSQITAPNFDLWAPPNTGRLRYNGCWYSSQAGAKWLQVNLLKRTLIIGVATQGTHNYNRFTHTYQLSYSDDGASWIIYKEKGVVKTFLGNTHHNSIVKNQLVEPFIATFVRFLPITYEGHPTVRMELYGCPI